MKRFLWMMLIFIFMFSLASLFANESQNKKVVKDEKVAIQKVDKKVSDMPKVKVRENRVVSSNEKQVQSKVSKKKAEPVLNKKPKAYPVNANKSD